MATGPKKPRDPSERVARRLLAEGRIPRDLHDAAMRQRTAHGLRFEEALIEAGASEEQVLKMLAEMYRVQYVSTQKLSQAAVDKRTLSLVPVQIAELRQVVPVLLDRQRSILSIVTSDPEDLEMLKELEIATQVRTIRALLARPMAVTAAVNKFYHGDDFAFSVLRNENFDVARAFDRDPIAQMGGGQMLGENGLEPAGGAAPPRPPVEAPAPREPVAAREPPHAPAAPRTLASAPAGAAPARVTSSARAPGLEGPPAPHQVQRPSPGVVRPGAPGARSASPPPTSSFPMRDGAPRPSPSAPVQARKVALTPPPMPAKGAGPEDTSPLPLTLSPAHARSEPPRLDSLPPSASPSSLVPGSVPVSSLPMPEMLSPDELASPPGARPDVIGEPFQLVVVMASLLEGNRKDLRGHSLQTARLVRKVGENFSMPPSRSRAAEIAALIHDLGKASSYHLTPYNVARFEGHQAAAQKHHATPAKVVESVRFAKATLAAVTHMYERYDGKGFPGKLKGPDIPLESRILAICDSYADLTANPKNSFRRVLTPQEACEALREMVGTVFDPKVLDRFSRVVLGDDIAERLRSDRGSVLLVDPDVEETTALELALLEKRYDVHIARALDEAVQFLESGDVDVVVSEMTLDGGTGFELLKRTRAVRGGDQIQFLFLSSQTDSSTVAEALDAGAADYLFKPLASQVVVAKVRRFLEQSQSAQKVRGVSGSIEEMGIPDIVQILHQGRKSGALLLSSEGEQGTVFFKDGTIVDAVWRGLRGEDAFYAVVGVSKGEFTIDPSVQPTEHTINASPEMLLLEGMRRLDEAGR